MVTIKNRAARNLVSFLALVTLFTACRPPGPAALLDGKKLMEKGRYTEAIEELTVATRLMATNAQAWNYLGLAYHQGGKVTEAAQAYQKALGIDHDLAEARYNLGCLWLEQNRADRLEAAKAELTTFTSLRRNSAEGWVKLGTAQLRLRESANAEKSFKEGLRLDSRGAEAWNGLGLIQLQRNKPGEAADYFKSALKQQPAYAPALLNLAVVSQGPLGNRPFALQKYREYLALPNRPANWDAVNAAANALEQELNPSPKPVAPVAPAAQLNPAPAQPKVPSNTVARTASPAPQDATRRNVTKTDAATNTVKAPASPAPNSAPPRNVEVVRLPPEPVVKPIRDVSTPSVSPAPVSTSSASAVSQPAPSRPAPAREEPPLVASDDVSRYEYRSLSKPATGNHEAAAKVFEEGWQAQQANKLAQAMQSYGQAVQLDPAYFDAYYNLGLVATKAGNVQQALSAYESALAIDAESLGARYNFALALKQANFYVDAVNELQKLLVRFPNDAQAHLALGNLYAQQFKQPQKAREHYLKVLEYDPRNPRAGAIRDWLVDNPR